MTGRLPNGPIQDFNVIYDAGANCADVRVFSLVDVLILKPDDQILHVIYCLAGSGQIGDSTLLEPHSGVITPSGIAGSSGLEPAIVLEIKLAFNH